MRIRKTDLAWAAGIIDGEGCIAIRKGAAKGKHKSPRYQLDLIVRMTNEATIQRLALMFGGGIYHKSAKGAHSEQWGWQPSQKISERTLRILQPFIFTKQSECRLALEFRALSFKRVYTKGRIAKVPDNVIDARHKFYVGMRQLKTVNRLKKIA